MQTNIDHGQLALARAKFEPVAHALDDLAEDIKRNHGRSAVLTQRCPMEETARNAYTVRYSLRHPDDFGFTLTFFVTGEDADLLLLRAQEYSGSQDLRANPGQVDQRVYRLEKIDEIKRAVREKISAHLRTMQAQGHHQTA